MLVVTTHVVTIKVTCYNGSQLSVVLRIPRTTDTPSTTHKHANAHMVRDSNILLPHAVKIGRDELQIV